MLNERNKKPTPSVGDFRHSVSVSRLLNFQDRVLARNIMQKFYLNIFLIILFLAFPLSFLSAAFQGNVNIGANIKWDPTMPVPIPPEPISESISEIVINNGAKYTNSLDVVLYFFVKDAFQVMVNNKDNFYGIFWQPFQFTKEWKLALGDDGERTVYAKFKSVSGGFSEIVSDSIILDMTAPANVSDLTATSDAKQIELKWQNPPDEDLKSVRILRSEKFFPINSESKADEIVFDQKAESFLDANIEAGKTYYYTVFSYDHAGNFSSGALISVVDFRFHENDREKMEETTLISPDKEEPFKIRKSPFEYLPQTPEEEISQSVKDLTLKDFDFFQDGKKIDVLNGGIINTKSGVPLTILIDYEKLPEVLKTIIVTLEKPAGFQASWNDNSSVIPGQAGIHDKKKGDSYFHRNDKGLLQKFNFRMAHAAGNNQSENSEYFSFLLRINKGKTAYQAKIQPPETGDYLLTIGILDIKNQISKKISGTLKVESGKYKKVKIISPPLLTARFPFVSFILLILILIVIIGITQIPRILRNTDRHR